MQLAPTPHPSSPNPRSFFTKVAAREGVFGLAWKNVNTDNAEYMIGPEATEEASSQIGALLINAIQFSLMTGGRGDETMFEFVLKVHPPPLPLSTCKIYCQAYDNLYVAVMVVKNHDVRKDIKRSIRGAIRNFKASL